MEVSDIYREYRELRDKKDAEIEALKQRFAVSRSDALFHELLEKMESMIKLAHEYSAAIDNAIQAREQEIIRENYETWCKEREGMARSLGGTCSRR